ncbi:uncharacterized protein MYCFIDRAFT_175433 [Pseudocercospora fijiensis CIRAD86]|uniref:Uncharacterized protein n=1 Tax=Pseudocercospora fijiensis (strain CIRAD86) TaxID=383855 RepID=M3AB90_PSEFD|nr:uncharacterized protein MYCFIDRAFT_175433 [Pseudocercospora fijiensis CIRAD86]EME81846.1 hypothetical protein MYCFIDRAFT_175433 [Pseudocercospora fijiensis CIRAD86]
MRSILAFATTLALASTASATSIIAKRTELGDVYKPLVQHVSARQAISMSMSRKGKWRVCGFDTDAHFPLEPCPANGPKGPAVLVFSTNAIDAVWRILDRPGQFERMNDLLITRPLLTRQSLKTFIAIPIFVEFSKYMSAPPEAQFKILGDLLSKRVHRSGLLYLLKPWGTLCRRRVRLIMNSFSQFMNSRLKVLSGCVPRWVLNLFLTEMYPGVDWCFSHPADSEFGKLAGFVDELMSWYGCCLSRSHVGRVVEVILIGNGFPNSSTVRYGSEIKKYYLRSDSFFCTPPAARRTIGERASDEDLSK